MSEWAKKLCRTLGLSYVWWHWKWLNFKKRWMEFFSTDKNTIRLRNTNTFIPKFRPERIFRIVR